MLFRVTDSEVRVWIQDKSRFAPKHVQPTRQESVRLWGSGDRGGNANRGEISY